MKEFFIFLFVIFFFQGCSYTVYHPIPPTSLEGKRCVKVCEIDEYHCKTQEVKYKKSCEKTNRRLERAFQYCTEHNKQINSKIDTYCENSQNKSQCIQDQTHVYQQLNQFKICTAPKKGNTCNKINLNCEDRYKRCFLNCGGSYYPQKKELF